MDFIEWIFRIPENIKRHGPAYGFILSLVALHRVGVVRRMVLKRIPRRWRRVQEDRMDRLESKVDLLLEERGISWVAANKESLISGESVTVKPLSRYGWLTRVFVPIARRRTMEKPIQSRNTETKLYFGRQKKMREYLKKLGRTKFQALLASLAVNIVSAILFLNGTIDIDGVVNQWMPVLNMTIGTISTWVYIAVEGSIDKANATKEVNNAAYTSPTDAGNV